MRQIRVLHITRDDKFFDSVFAQFELDQRLVNRAVLEVKNKNEYQFRRINKTEKVDLVDKGEMRILLKYGEYDVIFFYSMPSNNYVYFNWIPKEKIVIWWGWGVEMYKSVCGLKPLIPIPLYKPLTISLIHKVKEKSFSSLLTKIGYLLLRFRYDKLQKQMLKRVDFFQPVLSQEYLLMRKLGEFRAKEFYYPNSSRYDISCTQTCLNANGNILVGNSQAPTNNHLDVWNDIHSFLPEKRKVIIPVNYLGDKKYRALIREQIQSDRVDLCFLQDFMAQNDYFALMDSCSYAVFGVLRQQAMGNIYRCLMKGIKVFLYRDSLVYHFLKEDGFVVFAIEDIDKEAFLTPLSKSEEEQNRVSFARISCYKGEIYENAISEIMQTLTT